MSQYPPQGPPQQQPPWQPATQYAGPPGGWVPPRRSNVGRNIAIGCVALFVVAIAGCGIVALSVGTAVKTAVDSNQTIQRNQGNCSPKPCANSAGTVVTVSGVQRTAAAGALRPPESGNHYVAMQVSFHNGSASEVHANPFNFVLKDAAGIKHTVTVVLGAPECATWEAVNLSPGANLTSKPLCFEASGNGDGPLTLVWTPAFVDISIPLQ